MAAAGPAGPPDVCNENGQPARPRRNYSPTPITVTFSPNNPSPDQTIRDQRQRGTARTLWGAGRAP